MRRAGAQPARQLALALLLAVGVAVPGAGGAVDPGAGAAPARTASGRVAAAAVTVPPPAPGTRDGGAIYRAFRDGLADPRCAEQVSARWSRHFAPAAQRLARRDETLALFGYVVDAVRAAHLPTEYALIPFVESGYRPDARNPSGPAGMWQLVRITARAHEVPIRDGFDGRLSPVESTRAAVRYLRTLHGMFAGDWRLAAMAYNAGESRILRALREGGQLARAAQPEKLPGVPGATHAYVRKLQALSCLMQEAGAREDWRTAVDRPVPWLQAVPLPPGPERIDQWARRTGRDTERLLRLNPAFADGRIRFAPGEQPPPILAVARSRTDADATGAAATPATPISASPAPIVQRASGGAATRRHTVERGDNLWTLSRRYGVPVTTLRERNAMAGDSPLRPGMVLLIDAPASP